MPAINNVCSIFNGLSTAFFTGLLAVFSFLQWKAVEKQNKQNLFKLRLEHCQKCHEIWIDTFQIIERLNQDNIKSLTEELNCFIYKLEKIIPESEYLFNKDFLEIEGQIIQAQKKLLEFIRSNKDLDDNIFFQNLSITFDELGTKYRILSHNFLKH